MKIYSRLIRNGLLALIALALSLALTGAAIRADQATAPPRQNLDGVIAAVRALIEQHELTGDPAAGRTIPHADDPMVQLGKQLFFTKALGGDMDSACASCHLPTMGGGDDLSLPIGVGAVIPDHIGPGRMHLDGGPTVPRNAPTTFNIALWDRVLFHDGRVESLGQEEGANGAGEAGIRTPDSRFGVADPLAGENLVMAQARFPTTSDAEMRGFSYEAGTSRDQLRYHLAARLGNYDVGEGELTRSEWATLFEAVFGSADEPETLITEQRIAFAIGEYERSQLFVNNPWFAFVQGEDDAIDTAAARGALLFYGAANCAECHAGDFFTDEEFHVLAMPQVGPGKGDGVTRTDDYGRFRETRRLADLYAFRTPSLLNVTETGPWGHDGAYTTLEGVVRHHLNPAQAIETYDFQQLDPYVQIEYTNVNTAKALNRLIYNRYRGIESIEDVDLTDEQVADLLAFLGTLTDPCVTSEACLAPWMPSVFEIDPDGQRLDAVTKE